MRKFIGILLSVAMTMSTLVAVNAEESVLLSTGKPTDCGFIEADATADTTVGTSDQMVDDVNYTTWDTSKMWYLHSDANNVWLNVDLQDTYTITSIGWYARYESTAKTDYQGMVVYGANEADYSDKVELCTFGTDLTAQDVEVEIAEENIANYRYIRFEKLNNMGGQELLIYGYKDPATNANLSALSVEGYTFDVAFTSANTEYTIFSNGFPTDNTVTVAATAEADTATVTGTGAVTVNKNGINAIPVTVTSEDGTTKTYTINFVAGSVSNVALTATSATHYVADTDTTLDCLNMVNQTVNYRKNNGGATWKITGSQTGYIQVDLGKAYNLYEIVLHRAPQGTLKKYSIPILASNDPTFAAGTYETIGTTTKTETTITWQDITTSASLNSTNKYQYVRIQKNSTYDFYPTGVDIYALPEVTKVTEGDTTTVTVPSSYYSVGDQMITAIYNADGTLKSVVATPVQDAVSTNVVVTKAAGETAKVMLWNSYDGMRARMASVDIQ